MKTAYSTFLRSPRTGLIALLILFSCLAVARWNQLYFFTPDSARYVMMARSLVNGDGYRLIDTPGEPLYAHRPPGMSLLLSPAAVIAPYDIILAKATVLLSALALIAILYFYITRLKTSPDDQLDHSSRSLYWPALLITLLFAINPYSLFFSTIVMSEIPFMACSLAILYLVAAQGDRPGNRDLVLFTGLLVFLPFLRTIGIALVLAVGCWALIRRQRWRWLIGVACSMLTTGLWMVRNSSLEHSGYASVALKELKSEGIIGTIVSVIQRCLIHYESFCQKLFPDMPGTTPRYARMILDENAFLPGPAWIYLTLGGLILVLACYGMLHRRQQGGGIAFLYVVFSAGILSLWPWMQQRFTLPLLPVVLAFLPAGWNALCQHIEVARPLTRKISLVLGSILFLVFCGWQLKTDAALISANQQLISQGKQFYADQLPPNQFSNWNAAGDWIKKQTPANSRLITRRADIATTGQRYQGLHFFETTSAEKLHQAIQDLSANYLVTFNRETVSAFPWHLLDQDLVYRMTPVYDEQGVMILKLEPNRTGTVRHEYWNADDSLQIAKQAIERFPHRLAFQVAYTQQLFEAGLYSELIEYVNQLEEQQVEDVRLTNLLAWSYIKTKRYQRAIREFERAFTMPEQKMLRRDLIQGIQLAHKQLEDRYQPADEKPDPKEPEDHDLKLAKTYIRLGHIQKAEQLLSKALETPDTYHQKQSELQTLLAKVYLREGRHEDAMTQLNRALQSANPEARQLSEMLEREARVTFFLKKQEKNRDEKRGQAAASIWEEILLLVSFYEESGVPGKALALLEQADTAFPNDPERLRLLLKYQLFYSLIPEAEQTLSVLQTLTPDDPALVESAQEIERRKQLPRF